jgi:undecaprenyl-diphosphatase
MSRISPWMPPLWQRLVDVGRRELHLLIPLLLLAAALWTFVSIADEVVEGDSHTFDKAVLLAMRTPHDLSEPRGPLWLEELARDFTALGGTAVLTFLILVALGFLLLQGKPRVTGVLIVALGGGMLLSPALKFGFDRPRPDLVPHEVFVYSASFPSGHALHAAVVYLTLGALLARVQSHRRLKGYVLTVSVVLMILVGCTRVYLGVHWPTDVLAGWAAGAAWAILFWLITFWLQQRGYLESDK